MPGGPRRARVMRSSISVLPGADLAGVASCDGEVGSPRGSTTMMGPPGVAAAAADLTITQSTLSQYVPVLRDVDDEFRLRLILHDFGMVYEHAEAAGRTVLLDEEPELFEPRWDAFLGAYAGHLTTRSGAATPVWAQQPCRFLHDFWFAPRRYPRERARTFLTTPALFEEHGIWFPERELEVV